MSTKSPVSSICLEACAKRGSSRSIGCNDTKPGRKQASEISTSSAQARAWLRATKPSSRSASEAAVKLSRVGRSATEGLVINKGSEPTSESPARSRDPRVGPPADPAGQAHSGLQPEPSRMGAPLTHLCDKVKLMRLHCTGFP